MDFLAYTETPCERQPTRMNIAASGGVLLYKVRFHTEVCYALECRAVMSAAPRAFGGTR